VWKVWKNRQGGLAVEAEREGDDVRSILGRGGDDEDEERRKENMKDKRVAMVTGMS
jgi:hypothetical protein